jgi:FkbM family methyltransferase
MVISQSQEKKKMSDLHNNIVNYFNNNKDPIVLDLGTYLLEDTIIFNSLIPDAQFFCFEADERNIETIKKSNNIKNNIHLIEGAIGNIDGDIDFYPSNDINLNEEWRLSGSIHRPTGHLREYTVRFGVSLKIHCQKLDTWYQNSEICGKKIELIYSDLNGADGDMIEGAIEVLKNTHLIFLECFDKELYEDQKDTYWIHDKLNSLGFNFVFEHGHNRLYKNKNL